VNQALKPDVTYSSQSPFNSILARDAWLADSGASSHIANNIQMFKSITPSKILIQGVGETIEAAGQGTVILNSKVGNSQIPITLNNIIFAPDAPNCLLSIGKVKSAGVQIDFSAGKCTVKQNGSIVLNGTLTNHVYMLDVRAQIQPKISWDEAH